MKRSSAGVLLTLVLSVLVALPATASAASGGDRAAIPSVPSAMYETYGYIYGTVKSSSGLALTGVTVTPCYASGQGFSTGSGTVTGQNGTYALQVPPGTCRVWFQDPGGVFASQFYSGERAFFAATDVTVVAYGSVKGVDATLPYAGHVTGTVRNGAGLPLSGIQVTACSPVPGGWEGHQPPAVTAADGTYDIGRLMQGAWHIQFVDPTGRYPTEYWNDQHGSPSVGDDVNVYPGVTTPGIDAVLGLSDLTITAVAGPHGSISPSGTVKVAPGADQVFTIAPDAGHKVADVLVDGASVGAVTSYTFTKVDKDHTISASFAQNAAVISASAGAHGSIAPSGQVSVAIGADQTFTVTPDAGYRIADVLVDGASVGAVGTYTFFKVTAPHTIAASFVAVPPPVVKLSPFLSPGLIIGKGFGEQVLFTLTEVPAAVTALPLRLFARAASPPADVTVTVLEPGATEPTGVAVTWSTLAAGGSAASGTLPTGHPGAYVLTIAVESPTTGTVTETAEYHVAGVYAPVEGLPSSGTVDVSSGSSSTKKSFPLRLHLTNTSGGPVLKAKPRLYVFDLATGVRVFRAKGYFKNLGHGRYRFVWFPKQMKPFAAWRGTTRPAQLVIPLYTSGAKKGSKTLGEITVKW